MAELIVDHLRSLHTGAIDARKGYEEALKDADEHSLTPLFRRMIALHSAHSDQLAELLGRLGEKADKDGSFLSTVHRSIIAIRSLFGGLDGSVLPGLIDGEGRNLAAYDEALTAGDIPDDVRTLLESQKSGLRHDIADMEREQRAYDGQKFA
jgi:uncharacterized protein (TIGR02284 family)